MVQIQSGPPDFYFFIFFIFPLQFSISIVQIVIDPPLLLIPPALPGHSVVDGVHNNLLRTVMTSTMMAMITVITMSTAAMTMMTLMTLMTVAKRRLSMLRIWR